MIPPDLSSTPLGRRRSSGVVSLGLLVALAVGCRGKRQPTELEIPAPSAPASAALPVDRALPDELAEGTEKVFGFPLPRLMHARAGFNDVAFVAGDVFSHRLANYVRQRVVASKIETGPVKTVFSRAVVRGQPGVELDIEVVARGNSAEMIVHKLPNEKPTPGLSDEERWRAAGFKPDGTVLDPTHLR